MEDAPGPRLRLDQLLDEFIDSARTVQHSEGRLRRLIAAVEVVNSDLSLDSVLRNIVEAARRLTTARYGAVGLFGRDGRIEKIVQLGMDDEQVAAIGRLPEGHGLLGAVAHGGAPIRLANMRRDKRSIGQPPGHVRMTSFLGVPIELGDQANGSLYLADSAHGEFTRDDEEIVGVLATAAGSAIERALRYESTRVGQSWMAAAGRVAEQLMTTGDDALGLIVDSAYDLVHADVAVISLRSPEPADAPGAVMVRAKAARGTGADLLLDRRFDLGGSGLAAPLFDGRPYRVADVAVDEPELWAEFGLGLGPVLVVPLADEHGSPGMLAAARAAGAVPFTDAELAMAASFAAQAGVALRLAGTRANDARLAVLEDRERIAMDLHDHVIQELFAMGMELEAIAGQFADQEPIVAQLRHRADGLDQVIASLRRSIRALRGT